MLFRGPVPGPADGRRPSAELADRRAQDVVVLTMVSQETGLQIVWFLDKNFDYKGEQRMKKNDDRVARAGLHAGPRRAGLGRGPGRQRRRRRKTAEVKNLRKEIVKLKYVRAQDIQNLLYAYRQPGRPHPVQSQHADGPFGQRHARRTSRRSWPPSARSTSSRPTSSTRSSSSWARRPTRRPTPSSRTTPSSRSSASSSVSRATRFSMSRWCAPSTGRTRRSSSARRPSSSSRSSRTSPGTPRRRSSRPRSG
ncbi:MAG: hypothetical protein MZV64_13085 [Ignavibacteriales bacterium]|nr:hypothetical protein [Ignavibacteriales bacterium]